MESPETDLQSLLMAKQSSNLLEDYDFERSSAFELPLSYWERVGPLVMQAYTEERCAPFYFQDLWKMCCWILFDTGRHAKFCSSYLSLGLSPPARNPLPGLDFKALKRNQAKLMRKRRKRALQLKRQQRLRKKILQARAKLGSISEEPEFEDVTDKKILSIEGDSGVKSASRQESSSRTSFLSKPGVKPLPAKRDLPLDAVSHAVYKIDLGLESLNSGCSAGKLITDCCKLPLLSYCLPCRLTSLSNFM